jgi:hypothetical protein
LHKKIKFEEILNPTLMKRKLLIASMITPFLCGNLLAQTYFSEDFGTAASPDISAWTTYDVDGDGNNWQAADVTSSMGTTGGSAISASWISSGPLTPDNIMVTSQPIDLTGAGPNLTLFWKAGNPETTNNWWEEHYDIYLVTTGNTQADITSATPVYTEVLPSGGVMHSRSLNISAFAGQQVYLAFRHDSCTDENFLTIDDIIIKDVPNDDAALVSLNMTPYFAVPSTATIQGTIKNEGANTITAIDISWSDGTNTYTDNLTGLNITSNSTYNFTHSTSLNINTAGAYNITAWVTLPNDAVSSNDTTSTTVYGVSNIPQKRVLGEEATGTWCGWCPRGAVFMDYMAATHPSSWVGVAVHNGDPMTNSTYDNGMGAIIGGYPSGLVDRYYNDVDPSTFENYYNQRINDIPPVSVSINNATWTGSSRQISFDVTANFVVDMTGNFRINAVIVEDSVTGTTSGYNQTNYYAGGSNGTMGGYENLPNPVPAAQMVYDHVGRAILGGWNGTSGSIPASIIANTPYSQTYTYTLPAGYDETQIKLVGMVIDQNTGEVVNTIESRLLGVGIKENNQTFDLNVYPNPATDLTNITFFLNKANNVKLEVYNMMGELVYATDNKLHTPGYYNYKIDASDFANGFYIVNLNVGNSIVSQKITITK